MDMNYDVLGLVWAIPYFICLIPAIKWKIYGVVISI